MTSLLGKIRSSWAIGLTGVALLGAGLWPSSGCTTNPGEKCVGGIPDEAGGCTAICDATKCAPGNICVANACALPCTSHDDCFPTTQECAAAIDDAGKDVFVCSSSGHWPGYDMFGNPSQFGHTCFFSPDECLGFFACPSGLECDPGACYGQPAQCQLDAAACAGKDECNIGTCANHDPADVCNFGVNPPRCAVSQHVCGSDQDCLRCAVTTCDAAQCTPFTCITKGEGDATAYCTHHDCADDTECPVGYYCGVTRDPHDICGPTCSNNVCVGGPNDGNPCTGDGSCQKGNSTACGLSTEPCKDPATFKENDATFTEGPICLMRNTCLKRNECAPCENNLDCTLGDAEACTSYGGKGVCARFCTKDVGDCRGDEFCQPYVPLTQGATGTCKSTPDVDCAAPADCPEELDQLAADGCVARKVCVPASGACDASNAGPTEKFCHHCVNDFDCGDASSRFACQSPTEGQSACFDVDLTATCTTDMDCPSSPGGDHGECLDEQEGVGPTDAVYHHCYWPFDDLDMRFTCYPT
jgi:hypothetical protein